jgi:opacity protein-like surface antigen
VTVGANFIAIGVFPATIASDSKTLFGATVGGGFEYAFTNNFSAGIEGRYSWYGQQTYPGGLVATVFTPTIGAAGGTFTFAPSQQTYKLDTFEVMAKLNWKIF